MMNCKRFLRGNWNAEVEIISKHLSGMTEADNESPEDKPMLCL
jgi:hypothetical protein